MATKAKEKAPAKKAAPKKAAKKPAAKKAVPKRKRKAAVKGPLTKVGGHRFAPGAEISFLPVHRVTVERGMGSAPMATPIQTAKVGKDGSLEVRGLEPGNWCAAGPDPVNPERWLYIQFPVS